MYIRRKANQMRKIDEISNSLKQKHKKIIFRKFV